MLQIMGSSFKVMTLGMSIATPLTGYNLSDGEVKFTAVYLPNSMTVTGVGFLTSTTGNYTADNYNGVALYSELNGVLTLRASSTDDGTIWKGATTAAIKKAFSAPYSATAGIYYVGILYNQSAQVTAPAILTVTSMTTVGATVLDYTNNKALSFYYSGQLVLPTPTVNCSSLTKSATPAYIFLY